MVVTFGAGVGVVVEPEPGEFREEGTGDVGEGLEEESVGDEGEEGERD